MEVKEIFDKISQVHKEIYDYIVNTEYWIFYWITNIEIQEFIKEYPEDYEDRIDLQIEHISICPLFVIKFDEHPQGVESIKRYAGLLNFRNNTKAKWMEWNGKIKDFQIEEKEEELNYYKRKVTETEKELELLKKE